MTKGVQKGTSRGLKGDRKVTIPSSRFFKPLSNVKELQLPGVDNAPSISTGGVAPAMHLARNAAGGIAKSLGNARKNFPDFDFGCAVGDASPAQQGRTGPLPLPQQQV